jgi:chloride channel protein, CIC family
VAGVGWWLLYRYGKPLVPISNAVKEDAPRMPLLETIIHAVLQVVTVGLGSPLGREVAPRELAAVLTTQLSENFPLDPEFRCILIASAAGAGLAAVYNVPFGGALFALEVLLVTFRWAPVITALATSAIATMVSWIGLGNTPPYLVPPLTISKSLVVGSILLGPLIGVAAYFFVWATGHARSHAPKDWRLPACCAVVFPAIGLLSMPYPQLLGNGKGLAQGGFENDIGVGLAAILVVLRLVVIVAALRSGATGGLLTPGFSLGGLLGVIYGAFWNSAWPTGSSAAFAIVGSAAFLAGSMKMPMTAIVLLCEFTRIGQDFLIPISLAVAGSVAAFHLCTQCITDRLHQEALISLGTILHRGMVESRLSGD